MRTGYRYLIQNIELALCPYPQYKQDECTKYISIFQYTNIEEYYIRIWMTSALLCYRLSNKKKIFSIPIKILYMKHTIHTVWTGGPFTYIRRIEYKNMKCSRQAQPTKFKYFQHFVQPVNVYIRKEYWKCSHFGISIIGILIYGQLHILHSDLHLSKKKI